MVRGKKITNQSFIQCGISILVLLLMLQIFSYVFPISDNADAGSIWTQSADSDFKNGTLNEISVIGNEENAELKLDLKEINEWVSKAPVPNPSARKSFAMANVYGTDNIMLFGGNDGSNVLNDTWIYNLTDNEWVKKTVTEKPLNKEGHAMAAVYKTDKVVLFGGNYYMDDTWVYDLGDNIWTQKNPANKPTGRLYHAMATIWGTKKVLLYGGYKLGSLGDTWVYDLNDDNWVDMAPAGEIPGARYWHAMASIYGTDKVILYGGSNKTWIYDLSDNKWSNVTSSIKPRGRHLPAMATIYGTDNVALFGGYYGTYDDETWIYDLSDNTWTRKLQSPTPNRRAYHAMASVHGKGSVVLFGGINSSVYFDDTWVYKLYSYTKVGNYVSSPFDAMTNSSFKSISWNATSPAGTTIKFQLRTADTESELPSKLFVGPGGKTSTYYISSPTDIWSGHNGNRWLQYKVYLSTKNEYESPSLKDITILHNCLPETNLISPINGNKIVNNDRIFEWFCFDLDSTQQSAFQVLIDDNKNFISVDFDSGVQNSVNPYWQFPEGTGYTKLPNGTWYWKVRTKDNDADWGVYSSPWIVIIDTKPPTSVINIPKNHGFYNEMNLISGKSTNPNDDSEITNVEIKIQRQSDNYYWDGSIWSTVETWLLTKGTTTWSFDSSLIPWTSGVQYFIQSRAMDNRYNTEIPYTVNIFNMDLDKPISIIDNLLNNTWINNLNKISGSAIDDGGSEIEIVEISIKNYNDNTYWDGNNWGFNNYWLITKGRGLWIYDSKDVEWHNDNQYIVRSRASDKAGNLETQDQELIFQFDDQPPEHISFKINDDSTYTKSTSVILSLQTEDSGSGVFNMSFSTDGIDWTSWEPINTTKSFELSRGDGDKIIYLRTQDLVGNIAEPISDSIILDTTSPGSLSIVINDGASKTKSKSVTLNLNAKDEMSGVYQMTFSTDRITWTSWENYSITTEYNLPPGDGIKTIYFKVKDYAGNIARPAEAKITLKSSDEGVPGLSTFLITIS